MITSQTQLSNLVVMEAKQNAKAMNDTDAPKTFQPPPQAGSRKHFVKVVVIGDSSVGKTSLI